MRTKIIIILICLIFTGCYDYKELNELAIATGMAIDYENNEYVVSLVISNAKKTDNGTGNDTASITVIKGKGSSIINALNDLNLIDPKQTYVGHLNVVVISDKIAYDSIEGIMDVITRNPEFSHKLYLILAKDCKALDIIKMLSPLEPYPSENVSVNIETSSDLWGVSSETLIGSFDTDALNEGINPVISSLKIVGSVQEGGKEESLANSELTNYIKIDTLGIFRGYTLIGYATINESKGINLINDNSKTIISSYKCDDGIMSYHIRELSSKKRIDFVNGTPRIAIDIDGDASLIEITCAVNLKDNNTLYEIRDSINNQIKEMVQSSVDVSKKYKSDIFGFGNMIYKKDYKYWNKIKYNWHEQEYQNLEIDINSNIKLISIGGITVSLKEANDERKN